MTLKFSVQCLPKGASSAVDNDGVGPRGRTEKVSSTTTTKRLSDSAAYTSPAGEKSSLRSASLVAKARLPAKT